MDSLVRTLNTCARKRAMKCLRRLLPELNLEDEKIPPETLEKLVITMNDFDNAIKEIMPSAMREVYLESPDIPWTEIGGLEEVKRELQEAVEWPLRYPNLYTRNWVILFRKEFYYTDLQVQVRLCLQKL